jgi:DNA-binding XRE family transcriptional regulator
VKPEIRIYNAESLGVALRHFRESAELTQQELAESAGVSRDAIIKLENGKATEQVTHLLKLLRAVDARLVVTRADW